jgi:diguanylate cyclase (GGDEF)-like protein
VGRSIHVQQLTPLGSGFGAGSASVRGFGEVLQVTRGGVLIVEGDPSLAETMRSVVSALGHVSLGPVARGRDAVRLSEGFEPMAVLMEVALEGPMDGIEAARSIRRRAKRTPIIFVSDRTDQDTFNRALLVDPYGYVVKPFSVASLRCAIELALHRRRVDVARADFESALAKDAETFRSMSLIDELTGLYNRRGFMLRAREQAALAIRERRSLVLLFIDLDGLKEINDKLGHAMGDAALRDFASILRSTFRATEILTRISGDEFAVLLVDGTEIGASAVKSRLTERLKVFNHTFIRPYKLRASVGIAVRDPSATEEVDALLARADAAMYSEKLIHKTGDLIPCIDLEALSQPDPAR